MSKENKKEEDSNIEQKEIKQAKKIVFSIDINKLVENTRAMYSKKETGMASQLTTGADVLLSKKTDKDFILWPDDYFKTLTSQRGIPFSKIIEISGKSDSGKSTHALIFMKEAQKAGTLTILWDAEKKFNPARFDKMGGSSKDLLLIHTNNIVDGAKHLANYINTAKEMDPDIKILTVIDSIGACVNSSEDSDENEDMAKQPGITAKETSWLVRKISKLINKYFNKETGEDSIAFLIINQTYQSIMNGVGQIEKGGSALYYMSSLIIQLTRKQDLTKVRNGTKYKWGILSRAKVKKNHLLESDDTVSELDIVISAEGIKLAKEVKNDQSVDGWDSKSDDNGDDD